MVLSTADIENELTAFLSTAYSELLREYIFFISAMLISCAVIPIFIIWMFNRLDRKHIQAGNLCKVYTHKKQRRLAYTPSLYS